MRNNAVLGKTIENMRKHRDINLVTTEELFSISYYHTAKLPNYYKTIFFSENALSKEMKKAQIHMNKSVYLRLSIREFSKTVIYEF